DIAYERLFLCRYRSACRRKVFESGKRLLKVVFRFDGIGVFHVYRYRQSVECRTIRARFNGRWRNTISRDAPFKNRITLVGHLAEARLATYAFFQCLGKCLAEGGVDDWCRILKKFDRIGLHPFGYRSAGKTILNAAAVCKCKNQQHRNVPYRFCHHHGYPYQFRFKSLILRYSVRSEIPSSCAADFRLPLCFFSAFLIRSDSRSTSERDSSSTSSASCVWYRKPSLVSSGVGRWMVNVGAAANCSAAGLSISRYSLLIYGELSSTIRELTPFWMISTTSFFNSTISFFISKSTLYRRSRSEKASAPFAGPTCTGRLLLLSYGRYCWSICALRRRSFSNTAICSAIFFNCLTLPGQG